MRVVSSEKSKHPGCVQEPSGHFSKTRVKSFEIEKLRTLKVMYEIGRQISVQAMGKYQ